MKKNKTFKHVSLVALSAVLACGVAMAAVGCGSGGGGGNGGGSGGGNGGGGGSTTGGKLVVSMFCGEADKATNQQIANEWAEEYNAEHGTTFTVDIQNNTDKQDYFDQLSNSFVNNSIGDVMYVAPRNVKSYAIAGRIIDLTEFINADDEAKENVQNVWSNALSYYGYNEDDLTYEMGQTVTYDEAAGKFMAGGEQVGLYGLPKDYSNFSMGYNRVLFTPELKEAYTTTKASAARNVKGAQGATGSESANRTYTTASGKDRNGEYIISYAVDWTDENGTEHKKGEEANIVNIGIPTTYKPFNYFKYNTYSEAFNGGDPMATMVEVFTGGEGYTVTIPGFPDETFKVTDANKQDPNAIYDTSEGHVAYTYAEYGALQWALTYYLNTFAWDGSTDPLNGTGGKKITDTLYQTIYGGEQYEGKSGASVGSVLYLLPWLYSNDVDLINNDLTFCVSYRNGEDIVTSRNNILNATGLNITDRASWRNYVGNATNPVTKQNLNGTTRTVDVQYGFNSERFLETYGAFLAIGSDWNGNPGDTEHDRPEGESGWTYFRAGRSIFYGAGSWDAATRNESNMSSFELGQMPTPVAEKYALYSCIKGANYEMTTYSNFAKNDNGTPGVNGMYASSLKNGLKKYSQDEINANLLIRQDKWGARMDSVGYAVTSKALSTGKPGGQVTDRTRAAASLCAALTISEKPQVTLTYAGAQLPNFVQQCEDLINYQEAGYENGAFKDMITPEGSATVKGEAGEQLWKDYYEIAKQMGNAAREGSSQTVSQFLSDKTDSTGATIKYDTTFAETKLSDFAGTTTRYAFAMKVLRLVAYRHKDLDLNIRMQAGLNSVRDSSMYTYNENWLIPVDARPEYQYNLAYYRQQSVSGKDLTKDSVLCYNPASGQGNKFYTPVVFALFQSAKAQDNLNAALDKEEQDIYG